MYFIPLFCFPWGGGHPFEREGGGGGGGGSMEGSGVWNLVRNCPNVGDDAMWGVQSQLL